ncbi:MAG: DUF3108 domain-containing protein [bacterium]
MKTTRALAAFTVIILFSSLVYFCLSKGAFAEEEKSRKVLNRAFEVGEKQTFAIKWGVVTAGYATLEVRGLVEIDGHETYEIVSEANSSSFFDVFYKVRDTVRSYIDKDGIFALRFEKYQREGKYRHDEIIIYDQKNHKADFNGRIIEIPEYVHDILSAFYYVRTQKLEIGKTLKMPVNAGDRNYELIVKVLRKERVKVPKGKFDTILIEPVVKYGGLFQQKGRLQVWLTDDERKIPVLMRTKIAVGSIDAELSELWLP